MLSSHSKLACGPETHFFSNLAQADPDKLVDYQNWPDPAFKFITSISHSNFNSQKRTLLIEKYQIRDLDILAYLRDQSPSIATILSSITEQFMWKSGKTRWIEKTPDHIAHVQNIRKYFPRSPIIRIIRDPRDVALSLQKVPWGSETFVHGIARWKHLDQISQDFFCSDPNSYTIHYEDLITSPRKELIDICNFIGENFEENMLNTSDTGRQLNSREVSWKSKASQPIDSSRKQVWRMELTPIKKSIADSIIGGRLITYGYELNDHPDKLAEIFPSEVLLLKYSEKMSFLMGTQIRFWKINPDEKPTAIVFFGNPSGDDWFPEERINGAFGAVKLIIKILVHQIQRKKIYWVIDEGEIRWSGYISFIIQKLLGPYKASTS
jgi:hypothetical protein